MSCHGVHRGGCGGARGCPGCEEGDDGQVVVGLERRAAARSTRVGSQGSAGQDGHVWTLSGVFAGIEVAFAWIVSMYGEDVAKNTTNRMECTRVEDSSWDPFPDIWGSNSS